MVKILLKCLNNKKIEQEFSDALTNPAADSYGLGCLFYHFLLTSNK